ncbi:GmrSD restriction endonuclease domain-containing protein [Kocuria sp. cx-116]|uniref:GmrSD restriction endonuclease domain-containing protein n=1 Tax=Kocuria sp. cx-116 TaxID=2771378 RepID=UPI002A4E197E|nr:DUF1524 domain-containing protein [Kocuria sp. cx-116]
MAASPRSSLRASALSALALVGVLSGCAPVDAPPPPGPSATASAAASSAVSSTTPPVPVPVPESDEPAVTQTPETAAQQGEATDAIQSPARAALGELPVKGRAPKTDYSREQFGARWSDTDRNGCDTRNDILRRDLTDVAVAPGTQGCKVLSGDLTSPFTGEFIDFVAGVQTSSDVQIDHVVALSDAWQKGAQNVDADRRTQFANDPLNLLAVDGPSNSAKGDGDAATWLPPAKEFRCEYVARQITVKQRYELWVTDAEKRAMDAVLSQCPGQQLIIDPVVPEPVDVPAASAPTEPAPVEPPALGTSAVPAPDAPEAPAPGAQGEAYFAKCADARAAGAAPLYAGQPGYRPGLDGDGDGVACETRR